MAKFTELQMEKGYSRFLEAHPSIKLRIDNLAQGEADALGVSMKELRNSEIMRELRLIAKSQGIDSSDFFWKFVADTPEEYEKMIVERDKAMKAALGI